MKHAYLIIANRNHQQLQKLITMLDDSRNDIYLMIDKKSKNFSRNFHVNWSSLDYVHPINIYWGSYSLVKATLILLESSTPYNYGYYHLLSGNDLPLVNQDVVHEYLDNHPNKEFLQYQCVNNQTKVWRIQHHLFTNSFGSTNLIQIFYRKLENHFFWHFNKKYIPVNKISFASEWLTIDNDLAKLILKNKLWIKKIFEHGLLVDELFVPTLINYYPDIYKRVNDKTIYKSINNSPISNLRYIKKSPWGTHPTVFRYDDKRELISAKYNGYFFARKFDSRIDNKIINSVFTDVMK